MFEVQVLGVQNFMGMEIPVVEGGFGEGKRCISAREIAQIHNMKIGNVNQRINDNRRRFKDGIDIIDLKTHTSGVSVLQSLNFTKAQIGNAKNIYLLSERGYAKLIKIMDTDLAWEIHDKLMDEYFTMRQQIKQQVLSAEQITQIVTETAQAAVQAAIAPIMDRLEKLIAPKEAPKTRAPKTRAANFSTLPTVRNIAKPFGITGVDANKILEKHGIIRRSDNGKGSILNEEYEDRWGTTIYEDGKEPYVRYFDLGVNSITKIFSRITNASEQEQLNLF